MYLDKVVGFFDIQVPYTFIYYEDLDVFLWTVGQTLVVLLLILASFFRPYRWSYLAPLIVFSMQFAYVWRDEGWILHQDYYTYTIVFVITLLVSILFLKYGFKQVGNFMRNSGDKNVEELVNFVVEVHNHHFAEILKSADALELLDETSISNEEREILKQLYRNDRKKAIRNFEVRIIETIYNIDKPNKRVKGFLNNLVVGVRNLFK